MKLTRRNLLIGGAGVLAAPGIAGAFVAPRGVEIDRARANSLWTNEVERLPQFPKFSGDREVDLVIVGAGYTGLSCAYYAKSMRPDWNILVLESHTAGSGASSRNSGAVYAKQVGISDKGLPERGLRRFRDFLESENVDCDFAPSSTLMMVTSRSEAKNAQSRLQPGETWIRADALREQIASEYYSGAVESPNYFKIHPAKLLRGHVEAADRLGVEVFERSPVVRIQNGSPARVETSNGTVNARHVFIATNAYSPRLGFQAQNMFPVHQYSLATRQLTGAEIQQLGLDRWSLRFEQSTLPVTFSLTPSGYFFVRMVLGYASFNSCVWRDIDAAKQLATRLFLQRYPAAANLNLDIGWHGVTGHTVRMRPVFEALGIGNVHISAAYNGLGIMPSHNSGYLSACKIAGHADDDIKILQAASSHYPVPGDMYRSLMFKPFMSAATPV